MARRTFRLLKPTYELKKGALLQEECDDGNQDYVAIDDDSITWTNHSVSVHRVIVEKSPDWFVEVFPIHPEYATKEEIKQLKAKRVILCFAKLHYQLTDH